MTYWSGPNSPDVAHAQGLLHAELVAEQARRHQRGLVLAGQLQDRARLGDGAADRLVAEGRQALAQARRDQVEMVLALARGVAQPDRVHVFHQLFQRLGDAHAGKAWM